MDRDAERYWWIVTQWERLVDEMGAEVVLDLSPTQQLALYTVLNRKWGEGDARNSYTSVIHKRSDVGSGV